MREILYIVIPCYNEEQVLPVTAPQFLEKLNSMIREEKIDDKSRVLFVNDGSKDSTWKIIKELALKDPHYMGISQSRASECCICRAYGGKRLLRYYDIHRLRWPG